MWVLTQHHLPDIREFLPTVQVWCLAVSTLGDMVVTGSADRSIRVWERTDEPFFAEEEKENRLDSLFEADQPVGQTYKDGHCLILHFKLLSPLSRPCPPHKVKRNRCLESSASPAPHCVSVQTLRSLKTFVHRSRLALTARRPVLLLNRRPRVCDL